MNPLAKWAEDELFPEAYLAEDAKLTIAEPERRLLFAVLSDAIICFQRACMGTGPRRPSESERWIMSDDRRWLCSYVNVCEALDIAYEPLRRALLAWRFRSQQRRRPLTRKGLLVLRDEEDQATG